MTSADQREAWRAATARYRAAHPERHRASSRRALARRRAADPEGARARDRAYRETNPDIYATSAAHRRALRATSPGGFSSEEWADLLAEFDHRCAYCQASDVPLEREHMLPLSRGGAHSAHNIVPACPSCNRRKGTLTAFEFLGRGLPS